MPAAQQTARPMQPELGQSHRVPQRTAPSAQSAVILRSISRTSVSSGYEHRSRPRHWTFQALESRLAQLGPQLMRDAVLRLAQCSFKT
mmetsp:Transcript_25289/g.61151  ORF Transcript_25289/g.61151 Transcript_25289/m.61151 type:complete len:88 (+) Transcript_25289:427-690(+)